MAQKRSRRDYEADQRKQEAPYVLYGTPLPLLDDRARDDGSYVPLWKQEVTDERGRKRLHGAFTGGFSAGYFNSVGSKEGWAPSTFVSSRSSRAKDAKDIRQQKVEDFMDEEDIRERDEAQQLTTAEGFAGFGTEDDDSVRHALDDVFRPVEDTTGEKLLNRMGWKKGQGIGPRILRKIDPSDPDSDVREFPPEDSPMLTISQQGTFKGLGFGPSEQALPHLIKPKPEPVSKETSEDESRPGLSFMNSRSKLSKPKVRSGIGVGSLNDTGSDEDDPYEMGPKMSYNRTVGGDQKPKKGKSNSSNANPLVGNKPVFIPKSKSKAKQLPSALTSLRKCHDGKLPLSGFVLADELNGFGAMSLADEKYMPPEVPEDWIPKNLASASSATTSVTDTTKSQQQTATSRRLALNEPALPTKSVFDFISPAARDRLAAASGNSNLPPALNESLRSTNSDVSTQDATQLSLPYPDIDSVTATTALQRLRKDPPSSAPYATDLPKQGRYKDFLRYSADPLPPHQRVPPLRAPQHKGREKDTEHLEELAEFAATAELFKPVSGFFASRFTSASAANETGNGGEGDAAESNNGELLSRPAPKVTDAAVEAAKMGMFGVATRSVRSWMPTRLLCKRFGVEMPIGNEE